MRLIKRCFALLAYRLRATDCSDRWPHIFLKLIRGIAKVEAHFPVCHFFYRHKSPRRFPSIYGPFVGSCVSLPFKLLCAHSVPFSRDCGPLSKRLYPFTQVASLDSPCPPDLLRLQLSGVDGSAQHGTTQAG